MPLLIFDKDHVLPKIPDQVECWLCEGNRLALSRALDLPSEERIVFRSRHWLCAVDIAPLTHGHLLLTPKRHVERYTELTEQESGELIAKLRSLRALFRSGQEEVIAFEHCTGGDEARNCVNHVHIHVLPVSLDLVPEVAKLIDSPTSGNGKEYLHGRFLDRHWQVVGLANAECRRRALESLICGDQRPWRVRLMEDIDFLSIRIRESIDKVAGLEAKAAV